MHASRLAALVVLAASPLLARAAQAGDALVIPGPPTLDPPTVTALGVQLLVSSDDPTKPEISGSARDPGPGRGAGGCPAPQGVSAIVTTATSELKNDVPPPNGGSFETLCERMMMSFTGTSAAGGALWKSLA